MSPTDTTNNNNENQNISVPTSLPMILKQFCKAAIRTQPYDLLKWSSAYFRALAEGEEPPAKMRLEYPLKATESGLTLGYLKVLLRQLGDYNKIVPMDLICHRWDCLCLSRKDLNLITVIGKFHHTCLVKNFLAIAVGLMTSSLFDTMILICELFTLEPEGGSAMIPITLFMEIYGYLAGLNCDGSEKESSEEVEPPTESRTKISSITLRKTMESTVSIASQDTEADVNSDLESIPKDDSEMAVKSEISTVGIEETGNISFREEKSSDTEDLRLEDIVTNFESSSRMEETSKNEVTFEVSKDDIDKSSEEKKSAELIKSKFHPNVPGIGPILVAEEVASVAIWLTECSRRQDGMIGPRNLRHLLCPPLDRNHH